MTPQQDMLVTCRDQFALFAQNHRSKIGLWEQDITALDPLNEEQAKEIETLRVKIANTTRKAEENERLCREIQASLDIENLEGDILTQTASFPSLVYDEGITDKNRQTQLGVHFEEVAEMLQSIDGSNIATVELIGNAEMALIRLADHLKNSPDKVYVIKDRVDFLDACCDQLVTATISAVLFGMNPVLGLREVNRSNYSKLTDGRMAKAPVTQKWVKGPDYTPPDLTPFV